MKHVIILCGAPRAGKDTAIDFMTQKITVQKKTFKRFSAIDIPLEICKTYNIRVSDKTNADRQLLSDLREALDKHSKVTIKYIIKHIAETPVDYVFVNIRDAATIDFLKMYFSVDNTIKIHIIRVVNLTAEKASEALTNSADKEWKIINPDYSIFNIDTLESLQENSLAVLNQLSKE